MKKELLHLDINILAQELVQWTTLNNGNGRNHQGIRFGQFIHNKYDMSEIFPGGPAEPYPGNDGYNCEIPYDAYVIIGEAIKLVQ